MHNAKFIPTAPCSIGILIYCLCAKLPSQCISSINQSADSIFTDYGEMINQSEYDCDGLLMR